MTYAEWKKSIDERHGEGTFDKERKKVINKNADKEQYIKYKRVLGNENLLETFDKFQKLKYNNVEEWNYYKNNKQEKINSMDFSGMSNLIGKLSNKEVRLWYKMHTELKHVN